MNENVSKIHMNKKVPKKKKQQKKLNFVSMLLFSSNSEYLNNKFRLVDYLSICQFPYGDCILLKRWMHKRRGMSEKVQKR